MRLHTRICVAALVSLAICMPGLAQTKRVPESCESDAECEKGNCVQLKEENKKVCLYCPQGSYDTYWSDVQSKCKALDDIGRYSDLESELNKAPNRRGEVSLPWLHNRRELNANCLTARSTRENSCWKDAMDSGHREQIDILKEVLDMTDRLISESVRSGKAYKVDPATFEDLEEDEESNCRDLRADFDWLARIKEDEPADCSRIASIADRAADCREARRNIVDVFQDRASSERIEALKEAEAAESEAKRMLDLKEDKDLCQ